MLDKGKVIEALCVALMISLIAISGVHAQSYSMFPVRAELEGRQSSVEFNVRNSSDQPMNFRASVSDFYMTTQGAIVAAKVGELPPRGFLSATAFTRVAPRSFTLAPGQSQSIRAVASVPGGMPDGEYRTHLTIVGSPPLAGQTVDSVAGAPGAGISVSITPIFQSVVPVIVRKGDLQSIVTLANARASQGDDGNLLVEVTLQRAGARSSYGDFKVSFVRGDVTIPIGEAGGIACYAECASRPVGLSFAHPAPLPAGSGHVRIQYFERRGQAPPVQIAAIEAPLQFKN
jgi:P pilus assembly chaperone PapD